MDAIRFGTDGWRASYGAGFNEQNVARVADAVARMLARSNPAGTVYVGYDTRCAGRRYAEIAAATVAGYGFDVVLSNAYCPAPSVSWTVANDPDAVGALLVTGSHGSADLNGIKLRMADGGAAPKDCTDAVEALISGAPTVEEGPYRVANIMDPYLDHLRSLVDADAIREARLKVVFDPMYGASRGYLVRLLRDLGVEVAEIHNESLDDFGGLTPEPVEPWCTLCRQVVVESEAHAGLLVDGDGDRVGAVDEYGKLVSAQKIIALVLGGLVKLKGQTGRVVITTSGSTLVRREAAMLGCPVTETPIGFKWIYGEMLKGDVLLGAEESGGIGIASHLLERDGLYGALLLCELMAHTGKTLGDLVAMLEDNVGRMEYGRRDLRIDSTSLQFFQNVLPGLNPQNVAGMRPVEVSHKDGLRLGFADDSWLLLRSSGTEPLVRVYAEAPTVEGRDALLDDGCSIVLGDLM